MEKVKIFTRGESRGNPGPAAIGVCIVDVNGQVLKEMSELIGNATSDYAEYFAVVRGLQATAELFGEKSKKMKFELRLENETIKKQLNAEHQIKDISLIGHFIEIYNIRVGSLPDMVPICIRGDENKEVRRLVREALDAV